MNLLGVGILLIVLGFIVGASFFSADARTKRALRKVPLTPIGRMESGMRVRVTGTIVEEGLTLHAPFSGRLCAWYGAWVEEYHSTGKSGHWKTILHEERSTDFLLGDESGFARVRMEAPQVAALKDDHSRSGTFDDATPVEKDFLARHGTGSTGLFGFNRRLRYREATLELGEDITVMGRAGSEAGANGERIAVIEADPETGLLLSDDASTLG